MKNHIAARAAKSVIATVIAAVCFGSVAVSYYAATPAPATAATHTTIVKVVPRDNPWP
jgi:hypothetical protein